MIRLCSLIGLVLLVASVAWTDIDAYWTGWLSPAWPNYSAIMAPAFGILGLLLLFFTWLVSLRKKKDRIWTTIMGLMFIPVLIILVRVVGTPEQLMVQGLQDHLFKVTTRSELLTFARLVQKDSVDTAKTNGGILTSQQVQKYATQPRYSFLTWGHYGPKVLVKDDEVLVFWGGGFGHWGFSVGTKNGSIDVTAD